MDVPDRMLLTALLTIGLAACQQNDGLQTEPAEATESYGEPLTGMFRYMADAARFRDCRTGLGFPVAREGAYIDLERAYLAAPHEPGAEALAKVRGRYLERPAMEGDRAEVQLVVDAFGSLETGACEPAAAATLINTWWRLTHLAGQAVQLGEAASEPHMVLELQSPQVRGNGGCNGFFGSYELSGDALKFSALGATRKACADGMDTEQAFLSSLERVTSFGISGQVLHLLAGEEIVARFEAVYH